MTGPSFALGAAAALCLAGCAAAPAPIAPVAATPTLRAVEGDPTAAAILAAIRQRGVPAIAGDISRIEQLSDAPGQSYRLGANEWLHIHVYPDAASAGRANARLVAHSRERTQIIDWVANPHAFRCGRLVVLFMGDSAHVLSTLTQMCGAGVSLRA